MTKNNGNINGADLRSFYLFDTDAKVIFDHLSKYKNDMSTSSIDNLMFKLSSEQSPPSRWTVIKFFKKLEELGCGRFIPGRRGRKTRFEWVAKLTDVNKAAQGQNVNIGAASPPTEVAGPTQGGPPDEHLVEHPFRLRKDLDVRLSLPTDLTKAEAARLAAFIQTLPFEEEHAATA